MILINEGVVVKLLEHILTFSMSHRSVSHAVVVGLHLDPVPDVILINEGIVVKLLDHILTLPYRVADPDPDPDLIRIQ